MVGGFVDWYVQVDFDWVYVIGVVYIDFEVGGFQVVDLDVVVIVVGGFVYDGDW